jgi:hypothetical protein
VEYRSYDEDPELEGENDPEFKEDLFQTFKYMRWKPEDLRLIAWLAKQED